MGTNSRDIVHVDDELILTQTPGFQWVAAVHEAGHAVAALRMGFDLREVNARGAFSCCIRLDLVSEGPADGIASTELEDEERDAIYTLAGGIAESALLAGDCVEQLAESDRDHFRSLGPGGVSVSTLQEWRARVEQRTAMLVRENEDVILKVASALLERGQLSGSEVRAMVGPA